MQPLWLADNAGGYDGRHFSRIIRYRRWRSCATLIFGWCVSAAECSAFAAGGLRNARGTLAAGSVLPLLGEIMLRYVFF